MFHHLPSVSLKQLCALAHLGCPREASTSKLNVNFNTYFSFFNALLSQFMNISSIIVNINDKVTSPFQMKRKNSFFFCVVAFTILEVYLVVCQGNESFETTTFFETTTISNVDESEKVIKPESKKQGTFKTWPFVKDLHFCFYSHETLWKWIPHQSIVAKFNDDSTKNVDLFYQILISQCVLFFLLAL